MANPTLTLNLPRDVGEVLEYHFMINALLAGSVVAVMAGLVGWLTVMRRETFAGHTLSVMAFPGAGGAALIGIPIAWGYYLCCAAGALAISLYSGVLDSLESLLFGNPLGISDGQVLTLAIAAVVVLVGLAALARPLLFASVDPEVARSRGVHVTALSSAFLLLLGITVAATSQVTGPLLVFALLVMPAATAQSITPRPVLSLVLTVALGLAVVWLGMGLSYFSVYPAACFITGASFVIYLLVRLLTEVARRSRSRDLSNAPAPPLTDGVIA
jgi:zinc/manganese transport system permease protein